MNHSREAIIPEATIMQRGLGTVSSGKRAHCRDQECIEDIGMHASIFERTRFSSNHYFVLFLFVDVLRNTNFYSRLTDF